MKKIEYIRCPRCELNYIDKREKLCKVCQAELNAKGTHSMTDEEALELGLCPICKTNYITEDEDICAECAKERDMQNDRIEGLEDTDDLGGDISEDNWRKYIENDDVETEDDEYGDMSSITDAEDLDDLGDGMDDEFDDIKDEEDFDDDLDDDLDYNDDDLDDDDDYDEDDDDDDDY
jgi:hypothetical protein